jgi:hypothetical protein
MRRKLPHCPLCGLRVASIKGHMARIHGGYTYNGVKMRSSWEVRVAQYLDGQGMRWEYEERKYMLDAKRSYTPDFFVYPDDSPDYIIEVKGWWRPGSRAKFAEFRAMYPEVNIQVWNRVEFFRRGIPTA